MITYDNASPEVIALCNKDWLTQLDIQKIEEILPSCDAELRYFIAENLINAEPEFSWQILKMLASDEDDMVRAEACQSLGINESKDAFDLLLGVVCKDSNEIVQIYAILSLGLVMRHQCLKEINHAVQTLLKIKTTNKSSRTQIAVCEALYRVTKSTVYLDEITAFLEDEDYTIRCSALNSLKELRQKDSSFAIIGLNRDEKIPAKRQRKQRDSGNSGER